MRTVLFLVLIMGPAAFCRAGAVPPQWFQTRATEFQQANKVTAFEFLGALPLSGNCLVKDAHFGGRPDPNNQPFTLYDETASALESTGATGVIWYESISPDIYVGKPMSFIRQVHTDRADFAPLYALPDGDLGYWDHALDIDQTTVRVRRNGAGHWMLWQEHHTKGPIENFYHAHYQKEEVKTYFCEYDITPSNN